MTNQASKKQAPKKIWLKIIIAIVVVSSLVYVAFSATLHNYAQDAARPLEQALIRAGAVKMYSSGDAGRGPDNTRPGYEGRYTLEASKDTAIKLVTKVARDNGYQLMHIDSPYSYIDHYSDSIGKKSSYPGFDQGNITVSMSVYSGGDKLGCFGAGTTFDLSENRIGITLGVSLPEANR